MSEHHGEFGEKVCWLNEDCIAGYHQTGECKFPVVSGDVGAEELRAWAERGDLAMSTDDLARGVLMLLDRVEAAKAEALREAATDVGPALQSEVGGHTSTYSVRKWLNARAAALDPGPCDV